MKLTLVAAAVILALTLPGVAGAKPSFAINNDNSCQTSCHTNVLDNHLAVVFADENVDLGTQLNGNQRGPLPTFLVDAGTTVTLSAEVLNGEDKFAVQLKRLEKSGQANDLNNFLIWMEDNLPGNPWTRQEDTNPPYFTKDDGKNGGLSGSAAGVFSFDLFVDANTPPDFYDLEFAVAGKGKGLWYEDQHFYVEVVPEPSTAVLGAVALSMIAALGSARRFRAATCCGSGVRDNTRHPGPLNRRSYTSP